MMLSELQRHSMSLRWLATLFHHGDVPGEIQSVARDAYAKLEELRRKYYQPEAIEISIAEAWKEE